MEQCFTVSCQLGKQGISDSNQEVVMTTINVYGNYLKVGLKDLCCISYIYPMFSLFRATYSKNLYYAQQLCMSVTLGEIQEERASITAEVTYAPMSVCKQVESRHCREGKSGNI